MSKSVIFASIGPDGKLVHEEVVMADSEDGQDSEDDTADYPPTEEEWERFKRVPRIKTLRRALRLTLEEFSERYAIPFETLRDWEQGVLEPDAPARAYLKIIAADPDGVCKTLGLRKPAA